MSEAEIDERQFESIVNRLTEFNTNITSADILLQFAQKAKDIIFIRTFQHKDMNGKQFSPYTKNYAESKGVNVNAVNLYSQETGHHMLNDMAARELSNDASEIYFRSREKADLAYKHMNGIKTKVREFFGINNLELRGLIDSYNDVVQAELKELKLA
jgi:hypothetical protein